MRPLLLLALACLLSAEVESFTLKDGRTLVGTYDESAGVLTLDGPGKAMIAVAADDIVKRAHAEPAHVVEHPKHEKPAAPPASDPAKPTPLDDQTETPLAKEAEKACAEYWAVVHTNMRKGKVSFNQKQCETDPDAIKQNDGLAKWMDAQKAALIDYFKPAERRKRMLEVKNNGLGAVIQNGVDFNHAVSTYPWPEKVTNDPAIAGGAYGREHHIEWLITLCGRTTDDK